MMNLLESNKSPGKPIKIFLKSQNTQDINSNQELKINNKESNKVSEKIFNQILHEKNLKEIESLKKELEEIEKENETITEQILSEKLFSINLEQKYNKLNDKYIQENQKLNELKEINISKKQQYQRLNQIRQQELNDDNENNNNNENSNNNENNNNNEVLNNLEEVVTGLNFLLSISRLRRPSEDESNNSEILANNNMNDEGPPMTQEQLDSLPWSLYPRNNNSNEKCVICEFDFCYNDTVIKLRCEHKFHKNCLINRLSARNSSKCPTCKESII